MSDSGVIKIHGKDYHTVAKRVSDMHESATGNRIVTECLSSAELVLFKAQIIDAEGNVIATGHAEEMRGSSNINKFSALENAETSAVGRALAFLGYAGTEIASADEIIGDNAAAVEMNNILQRHNDALRDHIGTVMVVKESLSREDYSSAKEAWGELEEAEQRALWVAPSKGGIFTTEERAKMKSPEWINAQ